MLWCKTATRNKLPHFQIPSYKFSTRTPTRTSTPLPTPSNLPPPLYKSTRIRSLVRSQPSVHTINHLLQIYAQKHYTTLPHRLYTQMKKQRISPNSITYATLVPLFTSNNAKEYVDELYKDINSDPEQKQKHLSSVHHLFVEAYHHFGDKQKIEELGYNSPAVSHLANGNALILLHGQAGQFSQVDDLWHSMAHLDLVDNATFQNLIAVYGAVNWMERVDEVWEEMQRCSGRVNIEMESYRRLIMVYLKGGRMDRVDEVWNKMKGNKEMAGNKDVYSTLIHVYSWAKDVERVGDVWEDMKRNGVKANLSTLNELINVYGMEGRVEVVEELWKEVEALREEKKGGDGNM